MWYPAVPLTVCFIFDVKPALLVQVTPVSNRHTTGRASPEALDVSHLTAKAYLRLVKTVGVALPNNVFGYLKFR